MSKGNKLGIVETPDASGKMSRKQFEKELGKLQVELTRLQTWVKDKGARVIVVFEGRDTAGKGESSAESPHARARASSGT
jgi:polyphosphate kinase